MQKGQGISTSGKLPTHISQKEVLPTATLGCCQRAIEGVMREVSISFSLLLHSFLEILVTNFPKHH